MPGRRKQTKKAKKPARSPAKSPKKKELAPGQWFEKLVAVQARLRAPNGCPWDREQRGALHRVGRDSRNPRQNGPPASPRFRRNPCERFRRGLEELGANQGRRAPFESQRR